MTNDAISALAEDNDGALWIGTADGLLSHRDHHFRLLTVADGLPHRKVWRLVASRAGGVWVQAGDGVTRLESGTFSAPWKINTPAWDANICSMHEGLDGALHIVTGEAWLALLPNGNEIRTNFLTRLPDPGRLSAGLLEANDDTMLAGTWRGLYRLKQGGWQSIGAEELAPCIVDFVHKDGAGQVWANTKPGGLRRWDGAHWTTIDLSERAAPPPVICMAEDREGGIWIGTGQGLFQLQTRKVQTYTSRDGLAGDNIWSVCEGSDGAIWVASGNGLSRLQDGHVTSLAAEEPRPESTDRCVWPSRNGGVWIAKQGWGVVEFRQSYSEPITPESSSERNTSALYEDRSGLLWLGTERGVTTLRDGHVIKRYSGEAGHPLRDVRCIFEDRAGSLWFGQQGHGLTRLRGGNFDVFTERDGLSNDRVWSIHEDADGALWLGTENGLTRFKDGRFFAFTRRHGLLENAVNWILEDDFGYFWLSGLRGIYRVKREQLEAVAAGRANIVECAAFGTADGMESSETNGESQPAGWKARDGRLWFPTIHGVVVIDPKSIQVSDVVPPVVIEQVQVDDEVIFGDGANWHGEVSPETRNAKKGERRASELADSGARRLAPGRARVVAFQYTANTFAEPKRARFRYQLSGHDANWREETTDRVVHYTNLRPGTYRFDVMAANNHGVWAPKPASFAFSLAPHFWQTWMFYALCAAGGVLLSLAAHLWRVKFLRRLERLERAEALQRERARLARDLHDDLGANLTGLALKLDVAQRQLRRDEAAATLSGLAPAARRLVDQLREVIWTVNPQCDTVENFAAFVAQDAEDFLADAGLSCRLDLPDTLPTTPLDSATRHHLLLVVKEALHNAVKHAAASEVTLGCALKRVSCA